MTARRPVRIRWDLEMKPVHTIPRPGTEYSTVARFESLASKWPEEAWSVVVAVSETADAEGAMIAHVWLLAGDDAPSHLLDVGSRFELFEGRVRVAWCESLGRC